MATALTLKTLTIAETLDVLHNTYGMKISQPTLEEGIKQGAYKDFAIYIEKGGKLKQDVYQIFEAPFLRFVERNAIREEIPELPKEEEE